MSYKFCLRVVEARDIDKMDTITKSDPYCVINYGKGIKKVKTAVAKNTSTPVWNEQFIFPVTNMNEKVKITMYDKDIACDDKMASLEICLNAIKPNEMIDQWFPMKKEKAKKGGEIHLWIHLCDYKKSPFCL